MKTVTAEQLRELLSYDPETGALTWKLRDRKHFNSDRYWKIWNKKHAGKPAGGVSEGYVFVRVLGRNLRAHRAAWAIHNGFFPENVDHINGNGSDNRISNLRDVSLAENNKNVRKRIDNKTGATGVIRANFADCDRGWRASIAVAGVDKHLGYFKSFDEAVAARRAAERTYGFHENHGRPA